MNYGDYNEFKIKNSVRLTSLFTFSLRKFEGGYSYKGESHDFFEATIIVDGKAGVTADKNVYTLFAGQMILHTPLQFHNLWSEQNSPFQVMVFSFGAECFPQTTSLFTLTPQQMDEILSIYQASLQIFEREGVNIVGIKPGKQMQAESILLRLQLFLLSVFDCTAQQTPAEQSKRRQNYFHILSVMQDNLSQNFTIGQLASMCGMSVANLEKTVLMYSGYGAKAYYNIMRLNKAKQLLASGLSVKETAFALGFVDQNYFSARFKKWCGLSPSKISKF